MKRNISDLLDGYPADVDLTGPTPLSPTRIEELTMEKIDVTERKKRRFTPRAVAAIAVAAAVLCGSALAAVNVLGAGDWFRGFFAQDGELTEGQVDTLNAIGQTFEGPDGATPAAVTSNGTTITPLAALADENIYYLRLRVEAPVGTVLPDLDGDVDGYYHLRGKDSVVGLSLDVPEGAYKSFGYSMEVSDLPDADPTDNVKDFVIQITKQTGTDISFIDGISKRLTFYGLSIQSPDKVYTTVFDGEFTFDIGQSFESRILSPDCGGATLKDETYGFTNILDSVEISPLSIKASFRSTLAYNDWVMPGVGPIKIMLQDGTEFWPRETGGQSDFRHPMFDESSVKDEYVTSDVMCFAFDEPLDLDQVDYLIYGDTRIDLD